MKNKKSIYKIKKLEDRIATSIIYFVVSIVLLILVAMCVYLLINGVLSFDIKYIGFNQDSLLIQLFNTIYMVFLALCISVPIGVFVGIYMAEYLQEKKIINIMRICIETISAVPSIVLGMFASVMFHFLAGSVCLLAGALTLAIFTIPTMIRATEDAFRDVDNIYREGSFGLGASKMQTIMKVLLPIVFPRIISGVIVSASRCVAEAAALIYTAGTATTPISFANWNIFSLGCPLNVFRPADTLAVRLFYLKTSAIEIDSDSIANVAATMLILLVIGFNILAKRIKNKNMNV